MVDESPGPPPWGIEHDREVRAERMREDAEARAVAQAGKSARDRLAIAEKIRRVQYLQALVLKGLGHINRGFQQMNDLAGTDHGKLIESLEKSVGSWLFF